MRYVATVMEKFTIFEYHEDIQQVCNTCKVEYHVSPAGIICLDNEYLGKVLYNLTKHGDVVVQ